ncbi:hypothetical protein [Tunicatimonas pelagia]|uniref:hypothetical protein n=1 Tax=Tunicatimonas pelagia TaxID=931531 RepID=UPI002664EBAC|nr:hypothetical protein [Tunicatimonas pelagia]WKN40851.1 hypothetical protein P0M28_17590 [Tunicatimonas pelagia]
MIIGSRLRFASPAFFMLQPIVIEIKQLVILHLLVTAALTGLIWVVQLVHYPGFRYIDHTQFNDFQRHHMQSISYIVAPLMLAEVAFTVWLQIEFWNKSEVYLATIASVLLMVVWVVTFSISAPIHGKLATDGYDRQLINKLVSTNWIRTFAWSARAGILVIISLRL